MLILPLALATGLLVGRAAGGRFRALLNVHFRRSFLVVGSIAVQVALGLPGLGHLPSNLRFFIIVVTYLTVGWWLLENARSSSGGQRRALDFIAGGWVLNLLAIVLNRGMPVSGSALRSAGIAPHALVIYGHLAKHVPANQHTVLQILTDNIPVSWVRSVISPGDMVIAVGIAVLLVAMMKRYPPRSSPTAAVIGSADAGCTTALRLHDGVSS